MQSPLGEAQRKTYQPLNPGLLPVAELLFRAFQGQGLHGQLALVMQSAHHCLQGHVLVAPQRMCFFKTLFQRHLSSVTPPPATMPSFYLPRGGGGGGIH